MDNPYKHLYDAMAALSARCDGAVTQDGIGFNGQDTKFGKRVVEMGLDSWDSDIAAEVSRILPTYRIQLESYGFDMKEVSKSYVEAEADVRHEARDKARKAEYERKNQPYVSINHLNVMHVHNSYPIKDDLKRNGFRYDANSKTWFSPLNGQSVTTVLGLGITLTPEQEAILNTIPAEDLKVPEPKQFVHIDVCPVHSDHLMLKTEFFGQIPLQVTRAIPGRKWDGQYKGDHITAHIGLLKLAEEFKLTISDKALEMIEIGREQQEAEQAAKDALVADSKATETDVDVAFGDIMRGYQRAGTAYMITRRNDQGQIAALNADDMGLGKTWQALSAIETLQAYPAVVVCPANLTLNWYKELARLLPHRKTVVYHGNCNGRYLSQRAEIHIFSYNIIGSWAKSMESGSIAGLICDESHNIKNPKAQRTHAILEISGHFFREEKKDGKVFRTPIPGKVRDGAPVFMLTGTPILNRPIELVQPLIAMGYLKTGIKGEGSVSWFLWKFCRKTDEYGNVVQYMGHTNYNGAQNTEELHLWLRSHCMVQRSKDQVLSELPAKIRSPQFIELTPGAMQKYLKLAQEGAEKAAESRAEALVYLNALRAAVGAAKTEMAVEWANDFLETGKSLVVFADHIPVQKGIIQGLKDAGHNVVTILGGQSTTATEDAKAKFQAKEANVIVCSLMAANMGHTLTAASDVLMVQQGWNSGIQDQAEDRCHRIGQEDSVTAWYMIAQNTIDEWLYELVEAKRKVANMVNRGISADQDNESIFNEVLERALSAYGGR